MLRELPVREVMVSDVLTFAPGDNVMDAMRTMLVRDDDGAPVVDADGTIVGLLSTADLIVEEARVHLPTVIALLGAYIELPSSKKQFDRDVEKALGSTVGEVMGDVLIELAIFLVFDVATGARPQRLRLVGRLPIERGLTFLSHQDWEGDMVGVTSHQ